MKGGRLGTYTTNYAHTNGLNFTNTSYILPENKVSDTSDMWEEKLEVVYVAPELIELEWYWVSYEAAIVQEYSLMQYYKIHSFLSSKSQNAQGIYS